MKRIRSLILGAAVIAPMLPALASAQPVRNPSPVPQARICTAWRNTCLRSVTILGIRYCTLHKFTCIKWL